MSVQLTRVAPGFYRFGKWSVLWDSPFWMVEHPGLSKPMKFDTRQEAVAFIRTLLT